MSLWDKLGGLIGGGATMPGGGQTTANTIYAGQPIGSLNTGRTPATDVNQLQQVAMQQRALGVIPPNPYMQQALQNAAFATQALNLFPGGQIAINTQGQPIQNSIQQIGGGGGGYVATSYAGNALGVGLNPYTSLTSGTGGMTATTLGSWAAAKPPIFDPRWYNDYLEAREDAVVRRLEGKDGD